MKRKVIEPKIPAAKKAGAAKKKAAPKSRLQVRPVLSMTSCPSCGRLLQTQKRYNHATGRYGDVYILWCPANDEMDSSIHCPVSAHGWLYVEEYQKLVFPPPEPPEDVLEPETGIFTGHHGDWNPDLDEDDEDDDDHVHYDDDEDDYV